MATLKAKLPIKEDQKKAKSKEVTSPSKKDPLGMTFLIFSINMNFLQGFKKSLKSVTIKRFKSFFSVKEVVFIT